MTQAPRKTGCPQEVEVTLGLQEDGVFTGGRGDPWASRKMGDGPRMEPRIPAGNSSARASHLQLLPGPFPPVPYSGFRESSSDWLSRGHVELSGSRV